MTVEDAVVSYLATDTNVVALVSTRVHVLILPQSPVLPAIRVQLIDEPKAYQLRGEDGLVASRVQVDAFGRDYATTGALAVAIDAALSGKSFLVGSPTFEVVSAFRLDRRVLYEAEELRMIRILQDYQVWARTIH